MNRFIKFFAVILVFFSFNSLVFSQQEEIQEPEVEELPVSEEQNGNGNEEISSQYKLTESVVSDMEKSDSNQENLQAQSELSETESDEGAEEDVYGDNIANLEVEIPAAKRPKSVDPAKIEEAASKDEDEESFNEKKMALKYGTPSEINGIVDKILEDEDPRFNEELYDLFQETNSNEIRAKILEYFGKQEDPCLEDYAVTVLDDPYDLPNAVVEKALNYASQVSCKAAAPALVKLLENGDENYFQGALTALGTTGGTKEALYLADYITRDDLTTPQKQALMRTLGKMNAVQTFDQLMEIAQNEDENAFVRMYAAEAIGNMKKEESIPVLVSLYEEGDPNMRQYCIKGLSNYPDSEKAKKVIIQGVRDGHYKVRIEAIKTVQKMNMTEAMEYLTYRAKNDTENAVKKECWPVIAELNTDDGNAFMIKQLTDKKTPDSVKSMVCEALMKNGNKGEDEIVQLAKDTLNDDKRKSLRYALGKLIAKYGRPAYAEVCSNYIQNKDAQTCSLGLDMYKNARYESARSFVLEIAEEKKAKNASNKRRARKLLGMAEEEPEEDKSNSSPKSEDTKNAK